MNLSELLNENKIIPVAVFTKVDDCLKTAEFLLNNSVNVLEITLRTEIAFECIKEAGRRFPELVVGSGSVLSKSAMEQAVEAGAKFGVAPGLDVELLEFANLKKIPFVPGISTPSELNQALKSGAGIIKIFPAENLGGPGYIKAITAPFKMKDFLLIPTGGINESNFSDYLKVDKVVACGASYIVDSGLVSKGDFNELSLRIKRTKECLS